MVDRTTPIGIPSLPRNRRKSLGMAPSTRASIDLLLSIPDPPTPDERSTAKTAAAALSLRTRRKSSSFLLRPSSKAISEPFLDVTNDLYELKQRKNDLPHDTEDKGNSEIDIGVEKQCLNVNDSNMDLVDDANETVLDDGDSSEILDTHDLKGTGIEHEGSNDFDELNVGDDIEFDADTGICFHDDGGEDERNDIWSYEMDAVSPSKLTSKRSASPTSRKRPRQSMIMPDMKDVLANISHGSKEEVEGVENLASPEKKKIHLPCTNEEDFCYDKDVEIYSNTESNFTAPNVIRKSRKSMILPRREEIEHVQSSSGDNVDVLPKVSSGKLDTDTQENRSAKDIDMAEIKKSIRRFCALPVNERFQSDDALFVQKQTGYPLITGMDHHRKNNLGKVLSQEDIQTLINSTRRDIVQGMGPMCQIMEEKKRAENEMLETFTGCRSERRKGKYRYISISTGRKVKSSDYEKLYLRMLEDHKKQRMLDIQTNCVSIQEITRIQEDSSSMASPTESKTTNTDQRIQIPTNTGDNLAETKGNGLTDVQDIDDSIPSQDKISSDPEIAEAQLKLFAAFDTALKEYSDTILAIRKSRASKTSSVK